MELRTCPCCGDIPQIEVIAEEAQVRCLGCGLTIKRPSKDLAEVLAAWNRRVKLGLQ